MLRIMAMLAVAFAAGGFAQSVPMAPPVENCAMVNGLSDCAFKPKMTGNPTSVSGNRVILFRYSKSGGHGTSRNFLDASVKRLAARYDFTATITEDPAVFSDAFLANAKVVIMSNGDGDVIPAGPYRQALEDFNQVKGWGVIWIHAACAFITNAWPFGQQSCVQQYYHQNPSGTQRRIFLDSGTAESPNHGIKNPQTEFALRNLPGWNGSRTFPMQDEFYCFQAPARRTPNVNVLLGYDHGSGLPGASGCPGYNDPSDSASRNHNLAWAHRMGNGISIFNSLGHDEAPYTAGSNMGDSLLWRLIRYAAKDWERPLPATGANPIRRKGRSTAEALGPGSLAIRFSDRGRHAVTLTDVAGRRVFAESYAGVDRAEIPDLPRGVYALQVSGPSGREACKISIPW